MLTALSAKWHGLIGDLPLKKELLEKNCGQTEKKFFLSSEAHSFLLCLTADLLFKTSAASSPEVRRECLGYDKLSTLVPRLSFNRQRNPSKSGLRSPANGIVPVLKGFQSEWVWMAEQLCDSQVALYSAVCHARRIQHPTTLEKTTPSVPPSTAESLCLSLWLTDNLSVQSWLASTVSDKCQALIKMRWERQDRGREGPPPSPAINVTALRLDLIKINTLPSWQMFTKLSSPEEGKVPRKLSEGCIAQMLHYNKQQARAERGGCFAVLCKLTNSINIIRYLIQCKAWPGSVWDFGGP